jgi:predicted nucleotidyltransferase
MQFRDHANYQNAGIRTVLLELVKGVSRVLKRNFAGAWLQGSTATGHFDEHSDVDFIIGINRELDSREVRALQAFHPKLHDHDSPWSKHLEGSYFPVATLRDYRQSGTDIWYLDHGSSQLERSGHDNTMVVKWILREKGGVLSGPEPLSLIDHIPVDALRTASYQIFAELSYCRMLNDIRRGEARR